VIELADRAEIEALIYEHAWLVDNHQSETLYKLYTENGRLRLPGSLVEGREALKKYGTDRAAMKGRAARHVCTNLRLVAEAPGRLRGTSVATLYRHDGEGYGPAVAVAVADLEDTYVRDSDGRWRIEERCVRLAFESPEHRTPYKGAA